MSGHQTFTYSFVSDLRLEFDLFLPPPPADAPATIFALVWFHGGGLLHGSRDSYPILLKDDVLSQNWAFITASYRLLIPCTAADILSDVQSYSPSFERI